MKTKTVNFLLLSHSWGLARASFHNSFDGIARQTDLLLEWDHVNETDYPLVIHARVFNVTSDHKVNAFETDISSELSASEKGLRVIDNSIAGLSNDSFLWRDLPSPLPFLPTATYELQVLRQYQGDDVSDLVIAFSPPFSISPGDEDKGDNSGWQTSMNGTTSDPAGSANSSYSDSHPDSSAAIAASLVVPLIVGISLFVFLCMERRRKRVLEERRKERDALVID
ncbi:hypothetical protein ANO14919_023950 [Xylariales sp. No.14919]|nr:hypothetical protein ANO14919_023950 [Xylariales sp. No.14919]